MIHELTRQIESWDKDQISIALETLKKNKEAIHSIQERYQPLLDIIGGKTLKSLSGFPEKWEKLSIDTKKQAILSYPSGLPFFIGRLNLNGKLRVDTWRDSHYSHQIGELPSAIGQLKDIRELHLEHQQLKELPEEIGQLENLEVLNLSDNKLKALPASIVNLKKLRVLILNQNYSLKDIPDLSMLPDLEEVDFTYTDVNALPEGFFSLKKIKKITTKQSDLDRDLSMIRRLIGAFPDADILTNSRHAIEMEDNADKSEYMGKESIRIDEFNLNYLPEHLFAADQVRKLTIRCYNLIELADRFETLQTLEELEIQAGKADLFPASIYKLKNLRELKFSGDFESLPDGISEMSSLETIEIRASGLKKLPKDFSKLKNLKRITTENVSADILGAIDGLENLTEIHLENYRDFSIPKPLKVPLRKVSLKVSGRITDDIFNLPDTVEKLDLEDKTWQSQETAFPLGKLINSFPNLVELALQKIDVSDLSEEILPNDKLRQIDLYRPEFSVLPDSISNLGALKSLTLFNTKLTSLNPALYDCPSLENFRISGSLFTTLPEGIGRMKSIRNLGFERGQLESMPEDIFMLTQLEKISLEDCPLFRDKDFKTLIRKKIKGVRITKG